MESEYNLFTFPFLNASDGHTLSSDCVLHFFFGSDEMLKHGSVGKVTNANSCYSVIMGMHLSLAASMVSV